MKIILGWLYDLRRLTVGLPENKAIAWEQATLDLLNRGKTNADDLESNIGRYVNIEMLLPYVHHFLSSLRSL